MMKRSYLTLILVSFLVPKLIQGQMTVDDNPTAQWLVQNVLVGNGVDAFNVTFTGDPLQVGEFDGTNDSIPFDDGIVMSTGSASDAPGPPDGFGGGTGSFSTAGDPDLLSIAQQTATTSDVNDVAIIEFDFVPQGDSIGFDFIFSSNEYPGFVGTSFNDVFGFFISGPGINGPFTNNGENMAILPGTGGTPVAINTVNLQLPGAYPAFYETHGIVNPDASHDPSPGHPINSDPGYFQADGHTVPLVANYSVTCQDTFHLALKIGDGEDQALDSWVFLRGGSLESNDISVDADLDHGQNDSTLWEGCGEIDFDIIRTSGDSGVTDTAWINTSGSATAGTDYTSLPDTVFFPYGTDTANYSIQAFDDGIVEGTDTADIEIIFKKSGSCVQMDTTEFTFYIDDPDTVQLSTMNDTVMGTCADSIKLWASAAGGTGDYDWTWDHGIPNGDSTGFVSPNDTTTYTVSVSDTCGVGVPEDSITVFVPTYDPLDVQTSNDTTFVCPDQSVPVSFGSISGGSGNTTFWWDSLGTDSSYAVNPGQTSIYVLNAVDTCLRDTAVDGVQVTQGFNPLQVKAGPDTSVCTGDPMKLRTEWTSGGTGDYSYVWEPDSLRGEPLWIQSDTAVSSHTYTATAIDSCGVTAKDSMVVSTQTPRAGFNHEAQAYETRERISFDNRSWNASSFFWDFGYADFTSTAEDTSIAYPEEGSYEVSLLVNDQLGCQDSISKEIDIDKPFNFYVPNAFTPNGDGQNDVFRGKGEGFEFESYNMKVFDRWGELVFESDNPERGWDGTYRGEPLPEGVYVYKVNVEGENGQKFEKEGHVTIIR